MIVGEFGLHGTIFINACIDITVAIVKLFEDFGLDRIVFMNVCVVITVVKVTPLREFVPYGITVMNVYVHHFRFIPSFLTANLLVIH
jgi:hypothetical protein